MPKMKNNSFMVIKTNHGYVRISRVNFSMRIAYANTQDQFWNEKEMKSLDIDDVLKSNPIKIVKTGILNKDKR